MSSLVDGAVIIELQIMAMLGSSIEILKVLLVLPLLLLFWGCC
jgi:hypothetical protein